jgi:hypothetical protein
MSARQRGARLAHDVGKYVARTARNVGPAEWTSELGAMLYRDLYRLDGGRASAVFERHAAALEEAIGPQRDLRRARDSLAAIDALEAAVRRAEPAALVQAAALALAVESALRALAQTLQKGAP